MQQSAAPANFPKLETRLAGILRELLNAHYPQTSAERPVQLLDGAWDSSRYHSGSSMLALYHMLQSEPMVILEAKADGDFINFSVAYWGLAQETYAYQPVLARFPYREVLYAAAKARALKWKTEVRDKLLAKGKDLQEINEKYGSDNAPNLAILEEDAEMRTDGIVIERHYRVNQEDWETLCQVLGAYHAVALGVIADGHFLLHHDTPPKFIECLADWLKPQLSLPAAHITEWVLARYEDMFQVLATERAYRVPLLRLQLAAGLKSKGTRMSKYIAYDNGTVLDTETGLMWMRCALGQKWNGKTCVGEATGMDWKNTCQQKGDGFAGYQDWRIPNIEELKTLIDKGQADSKIHPLAFPNCPAWFFWSSSSYPGGYSKDGCGDIYFGSPVKVVQLH